MTSVITRNLPIGTSFERLGAINATLDFHGPSSVDFIANTSSRVSGVGEKRRRSSSQGLFDCNLCEDTFYISNDLCSCVNLSGGKPLQVNTDLTSISYGDDYISPFYSSDSSGYRYESEDEYSPQATEVLDTFEDRSTLVVGDLVGIEPNPGPPKKQNVQKKKNTPKKKKGSSRAVVSRTMDSAVPGRYATPRSVSFGGAQMQGYMRCLNDPFNCPPTRPGVGCAIPTGLFSCYARVPLVVGAGTTFISLVFVPHRLQAPIMSSVTTAATYTFAPLGALTQYPQFTATNALYEKARLLASGIRIIPMVPSLTDSGQLSNSLIPGIRNADTALFGFVSSTTATQGYNEYPNYPQTLCSPFKAGSSSYWRPQDANSFVFREATFTDTATNSQSSSAANETLQDVPFMTVGMSGITTTAGTNFIIEIISHFEGTIAAGNAGVIDLQRAVPTSDVTAISVADRIFGYDNRTSRPGYYGGFRDTAQKAIAYKGNDKSSFGSDLLKFGASVVPGLIGAFL
jgi:hypothetical protein